MPRPRTDIRHRILAAARAQFLKRGVDGSALRTIAEDAKTSIGMIYYYFPSKDELFLEVVEEVYVLLLDDLSQALSVDVPVRARIAALYRRIAGVSELEIETVQLVAREALVSSERLERLIERFQRGHLPLIVKTLAEGVSDGSIDDGLPLPLVMMSTMALGAVPQVLRRVLSRRPGFERLPRGEELADALVDVLFQGVGSRPR